MISCIVASMNRSSNLIQILPSWAKVDQISEIIVVDWSSTIPIFEEENIKNILKKYDKIKIVRVSGEKFFYRCNALNLAFGNTNKESPILLKIDADYLNVGFDHSFINQYIFHNILIENTYFHPTNCESENGFFISKKIDFQKIKGYNENFESSWGFEDIDLYRRFWAELGLERITIDNINKIIYHIPHGENLRTINQKIKTKDYNKSISESNLSWETKKYLKIFEAENYIEVKRI